MPSWRQDTSRASVASHHEPFRLWWTFVPGLPQSGLPQSITVAMASRHEPLSLWWTFFPWWPRLGLVMSVTVDTPINIV